MRVGVTGFQPLRLTQAREARGLTKVALANMVGRSGPTLSKWEAGDAVPDAESLQRIAGALGCPDSWFLQPLPEFGTAPYFFRSNVSTTKAARSVALRRIEWLQEVSGVLQEFIDWPQVNVPHLGESVSAITDDEVEQAAILCRETWELGLGPISDVVLALENAGVICGREEIGHVKMDGLSHWSAVDGRPYVYLVADKANYYRSRFDAAHELGHLVLHRHVQGTDFTKQHSVIEAQANLFASCFLLPAESFSVEVPAWPTLDNFLTLKRRWKVSVGAMIYRSKQLGLITEDHSVRLWKNYSARGWRCGEPGDDIPFEQIRLLQRAVKLVVDNKVLTKDDMLNTLGLGVADLQALCGLEEGYFSGPEPQPANVVRLKSGASGNVLTFPNRQRSEK